MEGNGCHYQNQCNQGGFLAACCMPKCNKKYCDACILAKHDNSFMRANYRADTWICYYCQKCCKCQACQSKLQRNKESRSHSKKKQQEKQDNKQERTSDKNEISNKSDQPVPEPEAITNEPVVVSTSLNYEKQYNEFVTTLPKWNQSLFEAKRIFLTLSVPDKNQVATQPIQQIEPTRTNQTDPHKETPTLSEELIRQLAQRKLEQYEDDDFNILS